MRGEQREAGVRARRDPGGIAAVGSTEACTWGRLEEQWQARARAQLGSRRLLCGEGTGQAQGRADRAGSEQVASQQVLAPGGPAPSGEWWVGPHLSCPTHLSCPSLRLSSPTGGAHRAEAPQIRGICSQEETSGLKGQLEASFVSTPLLGELDPTLGPGQPWGRSASQF